MPISLAPPLAHWREDWRRQTEGTAFPAAEIARRIGLGSQGSWPGSPMQRYCRRPAPYPHTAPGRWGVCGGPLLAIDSALAAGSA